MVHELSKAILGTLPAEFSYLYGALDLILAIVTILIIISPFIIIFKILKG